MKSQSKFGPFSVFGEFMVHGNADVFNGDVFLIYIWEDRNEHRTLFLFVPQMFQPRTKQLQIYVCILFFIIQNIIPYFLFFSSILMCLHSKHSFFLLLLASYSEQPKLNGLTARAHQHSVVFSQFDCMKFVYSFRFVFLSNFLFSNGNSINFNWWISLWFHISSISISIQMGRCANLRPE